MIWKFVTKGVCRGHRGHRYTHFNYIVGKEVCLFSVPDNQISNLGTVA